MTVTIGLVANVYNEVNALPGWLETHLPFFDDVRILHAGPGGEYSTDGTIELLERWQVPVEFCAIDDGFGVVRSKALAMSPCDYVMLLDADERFYPVVPLVTCEGTGTPQSQVDWILQSYDFRGVNLPNWENIARLGSELQVKATGAYVNQGNRLREILEAERPDAVATVRRHWHGIGLTRPTQNWNEHPDWQARIVRCNPHIHFRHDTRMHEQLVGVNKLYQGDISTGPFFDHHHFHFKRMEHMQRAHDVMIYDAIHAGRTPPRWTEFLEGGK